jgi:hypothetical protein
MLQKTKSALAEKLSKLKKRIFYRDELAAQIVRMSGKLTLEEWKKAGMPAPPPAEYKQGVLKAFQKQFGITYLIETGTFTGDMVEAMKNNFTKIDSIEIDKRLFNAAVKKFKKDKGVTILRGDSKVLLPKLINEKTVACLYWLDGHYSGGITGKGEKITPVIDELNAILSNYKNDVILIDDARLFNGQKDYPTINEIKKRVSDFDKSLNVDVVQDIIRVYKGEHFSE